MKRTRQFMFLCGMLLLLSSACTSTGADDTTITENCPHKDIIIKTPFDLSYYKGSYVIAAFISHYCRQCIDTITALNRLNDGHAGSNVKVVGIYIDKTIDENKIRAFAEKMNFHFPLYIENREMLTKYDITFIPTILFFDTAGDVVGKHIGHKHEKTIERNFFRNHNNQ